MDQEKTMPCRGCGTILTRINDLAVGQPAKTWKTSPFRCEPCGLGYSNASRAEDRRTITRSPELNVPMEVRAGLGEALEQSLNVVNRLNKPNAFCSETSED